MASSSSASAPSEFVAYLVSQAIGQRALSEVMTLTISGHWQQVSSLGHSLHLCTSLVDLDLSRNGLTTMDGLQTLRRLKRLNIYYNVVGRLNELDKLRALSELEVLDLRLNPVTHAGRHRMHALAVVPSIRLLDGREVTGAERARAHQLLLASSRMIIIINE